MNRVRDAEQRVASIEGLSSREWKRFRGHRLYRGFMREYLNAKCLTDFWYHMRFASYFGQMQHYDPLFHGYDGMAGFLTRWERDTPHGPASVPLKGDFVSRSLCKTQEGANWLTWELARDPNHRLFIRSYSDPLAANIGGIVRSILDSPYYQNCYPWVRAKTKDNGQKFRWRDDELLIARDATGLRTPTMVCRGMESSVTGEHFTLGLYDDWETEKNAYSHDQRTQMFDKFLDDIPLYEAGARRLVNGTPWHPDGLVQSMISKKGLCKDWDYELFVHAATVQCFDEEFEGVEPILEGDRVTVRDTTQAFPTAMADLVHCQVRMRFFYAEAGDYIEEIREVVENTGTCFRVNRPFPATLGAPLSYVIGNKKPVCVQRMTLDSVDWVPPAIELNSRCARLSLPATKANLGSMKYAAQYDMDAVDRGNLILNREYLQIIDEADLPAGERRYFRSCDFASKSRTKAGSAITTGFLHEQGLFITHMFYQMDADVLTKLLELFIGFQRVARINAPTPGTSFALKATLFEPAQIEKTTRELIGECQKDPHKFFSALENPIYPAAAEQWFTPGRPVHLTQRNMSRTTAKTYRVVGLQAPLEARQIWVVKGCPHLETLMDHMDRFKMDSTEYLDLLETVQDIWAECSRPVAKEEKPKVGVEFHRVLRAAGQRGLGDMLRSGGRYRG